MYHLYLEIRQLSKKVQPLCVEIQELTTNFKKAINKKGNDLRHTSFHRTVLQLERNSLLPSRYLVVLYGRGSKEGVVEKIQITRELILNTYLSIIRK